MLIDPAKVTLRLGTSDPSYLNIDYAGKEIGYVHKTTHGLAVWAHDVSDRSLTDLVATCLDCSRFVASP